MSARLLLIGTVFLVASCATAQENPNYQYSSKYGAPETTVLAQADPQVMPAATTTSRDGVHSAVERTTAHTQSEPVAYGQAPILAAHPQLNNTSPTEQAYDTDRMVGTPGYEMMRAQQSADETHPSYPAARAPIYEVAPAPTYTPYSSQTAPQPLGPREVEYDYGENLRADENAPSVSAAPIYEPINSQPRPGTAVNVLTGQSYTVGEGDTVYSLSRRLCAPMAEITTANGIGGDYAIAIGQTLYLPNSRC